MKTAPVVCGGVFADVAFLATPESWAEACHRERDAVWWHVGDECGVTGQAHGPDPEGVEHLLMVMGVDAASAP